MPEIKPTQAVDVVNVLTEAGIPVTRKPSLIKSAAKAAWGVVKGSPVKSTIVTGVVAITSAAIAYLYFRVIPGLQAKAAEAKLPETAETPETPETAETPEAESDS